jgi:DNA-binding transcriptional LysR family regulator
MVELASTTAIKAAVASGTGPGVLSRLATHGDVQDGRLVIVPTEGLSLERSIRVVWADDRSLSSAATRFLRLVGEPSA